VISLEAHRPPLPYFWCIIHFLTFVKGDLPANSGILPFQYIIKYMKGLVLKNKTVSIQTDLAIPTPKENEVIVKIKYASINSFDVETIEGKNDLMGKLMGAKKHPVQTGLEFAGIVETDGKRFKKGEFVFGYPDLIKGTKSHQEYLAIPEDYIALMPQNLDFEESAALPLGTLTSLVALEEVGKIREGSKVLINGAAGGLGVYAVQIAKMFGADITAIAGPGQADFLLSLIHISEPTRPY